MKQANKKIKKGSRVIVGIKNVAEKFCALCKKFFAFYAQKYDLWFHSFKDIESLVIWTYLLIFTSLAHQGLDFAGYLNNNVFWCSEIVLGIFLLSEILCTIKFHLKSKLRWMTIAMLAIRYITFATYSKNELHTYYFLGLLIYLALITSYWTAKDTDKSGEKIPTGLLTIGLSSLYVAMFVSNNTDYHNTKWIWVAGVSLIYLYAISVVILKLLYGTKNTPPKLTTIILNTVFYIALIIGAPFLLLYAGVEKETLKSIIIPIYAAAIGGIMTLVGVAWTIRREDSIRKEEKKDASRPFWSIIDGTDERIIDSNRHIYSYSISLEYTSKTPHLNANFVNSYKTEFLLKKIRIGEQDYITDNNQLISKGMSFMITIYYGEDVDLQKEDILLYIIDTNYKERIYRLIPNGNIITSFEEIT